MTLPGADPFVHDLVILLSDLSPYYPYGDMSPKIPFSGKFLLRSSKPGLSGSI